MCGVTELLTSKFEANMKHKSNNDCSNSTNCGSQPNSALFQCLPYVFICFCGMNVLYNGLVSINLPKLLNMPPVAAEFCASTTNEGEGGESCSRPDLLAFAVVSELVFLICGGIGLYSWHVRRLRTCTAQESLASSETRLFGHLPENVWLTTINLTYQIWDFYVSARSIPDYCTPIMMTHHVVAGIVAASGLHGQISHYYATFFLGLSEVSSIFLVICDLSKVFPPLPETTFHFFVNTVCAPAFVLAFTYYRVYMWWYASYYLFQDVKKVVRTGTAKKLRPGCTWVLYQLLCLDVPMGILQLYWLALILAHVKDMILGSSM